MTKMIINEHMDVKLIVKNSNNRAEFIISINV